MPGRVLSVALLAAVCFAATASADLRGPAELPPASYKGQQYVDSRGCVFLRAGLGARETWVPRISRDKKQLCGFAPSGRAVETAEAAPAAVKPAEKPARSGNFGSEPGKPLALPGPMQSAYEAAGGKPAPAGSVVGARASAPATTASAKAASTVSEGYRLSCPASSPVAQRFRVEGGGTRVLCVAKDGSLAGAVFPRLISGTGSQGREQRWSGPAVSVTTGKAVTISAGSAAGTTPAPPPGYKPAWEDDRLNPMRGGPEAKRNAVSASAGSAGETVTVRVRAADGSLREETGLVLETGADGKRKVQLTGAAAAKPAPVTGGVFIQVGTFAVASNATGTAARLRALGLPVAQSAIKGGTLQVVYAGPFAGGAAAQAALSQVRSAGFGDALILR